MAVVRLSYRAVRLRRVTPRRVLIAAGILAIGVVAGKFGGRVSQVAEIAYWQHRCLSHVGDPARVVCEERIDCPVSIGPGLVVDRTNALGTRLTVSPLRCFERFAAACGWRHVGGVSISSTEATVLFCGRLATASGGERLVVVTRRVPRFERWDTEIDLGQNFGMDIFTPGSLRARPIAQCEIGGTERARPGPILSYSRRTRFSRVFQTPRTAAGSPSVMTWMACPA